MKQQTTQRRVSIFLGLLFVLILVQLASSTPIRGGFNSNDQVNAVKDCFLVKGDSSSLLCKSIPKCTDRTYSLFQQFNRIIFDLASSSSTNGSRGGVLGERAFRNCSFSWSSQIELEFRNVNQIGSYAFEYVKIDSEIRLTVKLDGFSGIAGSNSADEAKSTRRPRKNLAIRQNAFKNLQVQRSSQFIVEISNFKRVSVQDALIETVWQDENSAVHLNIHDVESLVIKRKSDNKDSTASDDDDDDDDEQDEELRNSVEKASRFPPSHFDSFRNNKSYSLEIMHVSAVKLYSQTFASLQVNPYSGVAIIIQFAQSVYFADSAFESLMLGVYSQFNLVIDNVNMIALGSNLFNGMQQDKNSAFYFQMDQIGQQSLQAQHQMHSSQKQQQQQQLKGKSRRAAATTTTKESEGEEDDEYEDYSGDDSDAASDYDDYSDEEDDAFVFTSWFCLPEGLFRNVQQYESALAQVHLTDFDMSISVSSQAFSEIQMSENAKFQLLFQNVRGHIVLDQKAINLVKLGDGFFEVWIENHHQQQAVRGTNNNNNQSSRQNGSFSPSRLMRRARNNYFKLMQQSINQIILTPKSNFRLGFVNSDAVFLSQPQSLSGFRVEPFETRSKKMDFPESTFYEDYRTKISIEIKDSENVCLDFMTKLLAPLSGTAGKTGAGGVREISFELPKVIELDGYQPMLTVIKSDGSIDTTNAIASAIAAQNQNEPAKNDSVGSESKPSRGLAFSARPKGDMFKRRLLKTDNYLTKEFCRYFKARPFIALSKSSSSKTSSSAASVAGQDNLLYFSEASKLSSKLGIYSPKLTCTSCLFIYLYRTVHRRPDFYFVKDHLPSCFVNLHYKNNLYFLSNRNENERLASMQNIEDNFKQYWKLLRCESITGLNAILAYDRVEYPSDQTEREDELIGQHCKQKLKTDDELESVASIDPDDWHDNSLRICSQNVAQAKLFSADDDSSVNSTKILLKLNKNDSKAAPQSKNAGSTALIVVLVLLAVVITLMFIYVRNKRPNRPCLHLNIPRSMKSFHRLTNPTTVKTATTTRASGNGGVVTTLADPNYFVNGGGQAKYHASDDLDVPEMDPDGYEYDDEFEISEKNINGHRLPLEDPAERGAAAADKIEFSGPNQGEQSEAPSLASFIVNRSLFRLKQMKANIFDKELIKLGLLNQTSNFKQFTNNISSTLTSSSASSADNKYPKYGYNSTDSTLVQTNVPNEFKIALNKPQNQVSIEDDNELDLDAAAAATGDSKAHSVVTYDVSKQKTKPNLVNSSYQALVATSSDYKYDQGAAKADDDDDYLFFNSRKFEDSIRVASNPIHDLESKISSSAEASNKPESSKEAAKPSKHSKSRASKSKAKGGSSDA